MNNHINCYLCAYSFCNFDDCGACFLDAAALTSHQAQMHGVDGELCGIGECQQRFTHKSQKASHQAQVRGVGGELCGISEWQKRFTKKSQKASHQAEAHGMGGELFGIGECQQRFTHKSQKRKVTSIENITSGLKHLKCNQSIPSKGLIDRKIEKLDKETTPRKYSLRMPQEEGAKKEPIKILSYYSKGELLNFNFKAKSAKDKKLVTCRHLAEARARGVIGTKESGKFSSVSSVKQISENTHIKTDDELKETTTNDFKKAQESYYFNQNGLGAVLQAAITHQKDRNCYQKMYYFGSLNHIMTLEMIWSDDHNEIKLNFYDPNDTARERRIIVSSFDALKHVTLDDLIPTRVKNENALARLYSEKVYKKDYVILKK